MNKPSPELLKSLNLTEDQAAVYLASLQLGQATIQEIAKKSGVKRTSIYNFLEELKERQLLVETKKRKRHVYAAAAPEQLVELEKTRLHELNRLLPELTAIQNAVRRKPRVTFYEGVEGLKLVYADMLRAKQELIGYADFEHSAKVMGTYFAESFLPERKARNIFFRGIVPASPAARVWAAKDNQWFRETRMAPKGDITTELIIYGNTIAHLSFRASPPIGVIIEDADIATTMRTAWQSLWDELGDVAKYKEKPMDATKNTD